MVRNGAQVQKEHYLPRPARGEVVFCFALTGPQAGSDAGAFPDRSRVCLADYRGYGETLGLRMDWDTVLQEMRAATG